MTKRTVTTIRRTRSGNGWSLLSCQATAGASTQSTKFRWYNVYRLPERLGAGTIAVRLHGNQGDEKRRFNRTESIRPIPATDSDFAGLDQRRLDCSRLHQPRRLNKTAHIATQSDGVANRTYPHF